MDSPTPSHPGPDITLASTGRLAAVDSCGLDAGGDAEFDRYAAMVAKVLEVPVGLVTLVDAGRQFFPGAAGLAEPWQQSRQTPLSHSFCQLVVTSAGPVVIPDARADPRVRDNPAIDALGVAAYAGMPLTDVDGQVVGALCAIDHRPHVWSGRELDLLGDLAAACSAALRSRIASIVAERASAAHQRSEATARDLAREVQAALERSQILLAASQQLSDTGTVEDVVRAVHRLVSGGNAPSRVSIWTRESPGRRAQVVGTDDASHQTHRQIVELDDDTPVSDVLNTGQARFITDRRTRSLASARHPEDTDGAAMAAVPLTGPHGVIGALTFSWDQPHPIDIGEQAVITALAGYVSHALARATHLNDRTSAAETLQRALLTPMPQFQGVDLAARYLPASQHDRVGGDWYDAVPLTPDVLALVIGDVTGHDIRAASAMSQLRSLLRGYLVDRHEPPSAILRRLDHANFVLGARTIATAIVAYLERTDQGFRLRWSNAGHPPPILVHPDGIVTELVGSNPLLGATQRISRTNHEADIPPGSTLLLHSDGLAESRTAAWHDQMAKIHALVADRAQNPLDELVDAITAHLSTAPGEDDVAMLGIRIGAPGSYQQSGSHPPIPGQTRGETRWTPTSHKARDHPPSPASPPTSPLRTSARSATP
ncbi:GAF domain-containing SpoIIE family protein phosphatase [Asanoa siamensis]|uniref:GAF domain-containing protein n=1 Tax=Asanoa siamensis TaxID=926357 RepID=A0ABQ4CYN1_9ACTN|nr:SpoIIE family protein phosphatase [Asanoa siamensis]GIF75952.1 hypothetical protein Asi02nite_54700 [Asanoa siamensis]